MMKKKKNIGGFSLVELSVALVLVGLFTSTCIETYRTYSKVRLVRTTYVNGYSAQKAMARYFVENEALPCPADPTLPPEHVQAGMSDCAVANSLAVGACTSSGGICKFEGYWDSDGDSVNDPVVMGGLPYVSIGMVYKESYDGWGRKMSYAVTLRETSPLTYGVDGGAINLVTPVGITAGDNSTGDPVTSTIAKGRYKLVVFSHGSDGKGSYTPQGKAIPCATVGLDRENCNMDATFLTESGFNDNGTPLVIADDFTQNIRALVEGTSFYDDYVLFYEIDTAAGFWVNTEVDPDNITNSGSGKVGINQLLPEEKLDVKGNVLADNVKAPFFCDENGDNCFDPGIIGGPVGLSCSGTNGISGVANNNVICPDYIGTTAVTMPTAATVCPLGQWAVGIDGAGKIKCGSIP